MSRLSKILRELGLMQARGVQPQEARLAAVQAIQSTVALEQAVSRLQDEINHFHLQMSARFDALARERLRNVQLALRREIMQLRAEMAAATPGNPCIHGFKVFCQTDEDGIIHDILQRIPGHSRTFVEIGCGNGVENNTHYLALQGYRGCWIDGSADNIGAIERALGALRFRDLLVEQHFVSCENIARLIDGACEFVGTREPGLFSLDIDGNEFDVVADALKRFSPQVLCLEYNAKFPPPSVVAMHYDSRHVWSGDDYHGASLQALCDRLSKSYKLVSTNLTGVNAFFVRRDCGGAFSDYTAQQLYQPFREELIDHRAEHPPSLKWLRDKLV